MAEQSVDMIYTALNQTMEVMQSRIKKEITPFGLNCNEYEILKYIYHNGDQPIQKIGEEIMVTSGSMTYLIDKLEKNGHLVRKPCTSDGRVMYGSLSDKGRALMDEVMPKCSNVINNIIEDFDAHEIEQTIQMLDKMKNKAVLN